MAGPYITPTRDTFARWVADVKDAGGVVTVIPPQVSSLNAGAYAARFPAEAGLPRGSYTYVIAPYAVLLWEFGQLTEEQYTLAVAELQDYVRALGSNVAENVGDVIGSVGEGVGAGIGHVVAGWWWLLAAGLGVLWLTRGRGGSFKEWE